MSRDIEYKLETFESKTQCPYNVLSKSDPQAIFVGSVLCEECEHFGLDIFSPPTGTGVGIIRCDHE